MESKIFISKTQSSYRVLIYVCQVREMQTSIIRLICSGRVSLLFIQPWSVFRPLTASDSSAVPGMENVTFYLFASHLLHFPLNRGLLS